MLYQILVFACGFGLSFYWKMSARKIAKQGVHSLNKIPYQKRQRAQEWKSHLKKGCLFRLSAVCGGREDAAQQQH
jgi:hypothetical protein